MTIKVEYFGGPRDGLVAEYELDEFTEHLLCHVNPHENHGGDLVPGTLVHVWEGPTEVPPAGRALKCQYLGVSVFGGEDW